MSKFFLCKCTLKISNIKKIIYFKILFKCNMCVSDRPFTQEMHTLYCISDAIDWKKIRIL